MGLFFTAPSKPSSPVSGGASFTGSGHISSRELREQVRRDLHDRLGRIKGESVYGVLDAHLDRDRGASSRGVTGSEIESMLDTLKDNHRDNIHEGDLDHVRDVLGKHFND